MTAKRNLLTWTVGKMLFSLQNKETPTDAEWDNFLDALKSHRANFATLRILVITDGGGPDAGQRKRLQLALAGQEVRVAVVTDSIKVRFIVSSVALLNRHISTFLRSEIDRAYAYLGMNEMEQQQAIRTLKEMEKMIDTPVPASHGAGR